jgi:hypothetical protein
MQRDWYRGIAGILHTSGDTTLFSTVDPTYYYGIGFYLPGRLDNMSQFQTWRLPLQTQLEQTSLGSNDWIVVRSLDPDVANGEAYLLSHSWQQVKFNGVLVYDRGPGCGKNSFQGG